MRTLARLPAILLVAPICAATAQERTPLLEPGQRVRVTAVDSGVRNRVGTLRVLKPDSIVLEDGLMLPVASVTKLEVSRGQQSHAVQGAVIAGGIGVIIGSLGGAKNCAESSGWTDDPVGDCLTVSILAATALGGGGAVIGAVVGSLIKTDRWEEVPLGQLRVSVVPQRRGFGIGARVTF